MRPTLFPHPLGYLVCPFCEDLYPVGTLCPCDALDAAPCPRWLRLTVWLGVGVGSGAGWWGLWALARWASAVLGGR